MTERTRNKISRLNQMVYVLCNLRKLANQLHHLDEASCNYGLTDRQEKREEKLEKIANDFAKKIGFLAYHQGDPRGCSLYLVTKDMGNDYSKGVAIY